MITKAGYICIAEKLDSMLCFLYGSSSSNPKTPVHISENLLPFQTLKTARSAKNELEKILLKQGFDRIAIATLVMHIAQSEDEFQKLEKRDLVVIAQNKFQDTIEHRLYGDLRTGAAQPGETLTQNGLKLYQNMRRPLDMVSQMNRQGEMSATIANMFIKYLD